MEFTREAWENAPEGARLEYCPCENIRPKPVLFVGFRSDGVAVVEFEGMCISAVPSSLRIILPKRKVTVRLWRMGSGQLATSYVNEERWAAGADWTLLGEHTFEIEGE